MAKEKRLAEKITIMKLGGEKLSTILSQLVALVKVKTNLLDIERKAILLIEESKGKPAFMQVPGYKWATCININDGIVHGVPKDYILRKNDVVSIDVGINFRGYITDMCWTQRVQAQNSPAWPGQSRGRAKLKTQNSIDIDKFLTIGRKALEEAIMKVKPGNRVGHISRKIQEIIEASGYNVAKTLTGHGVGLKLHETPAIPCFLKTDINQTPILKSGMTLAIEVIYTMGKTDLITDKNDGWTIRTKDGKIAAVFEKTIAVTADGCLVLTKLPDERIFDKISKDDK